MASRDTSRDSQHAKSSLKRVKSRVIFVNYNVLLYKSINTVICVLFQGHPFCLIAKGKYLLKLALEALYTTSNSMQTRLKILLFYAFFTFLRNGISIFPIRITRRTCVTSSLTPCAISGKDIFGKAHNLSSEADSRMKRGAWPSREIHELMWRIFSLTKKRQTGGCYFTRSTQQVSVKKQR